jgi:hypothetical protein
MLISRTTMGPMMLDLIFSMNSGRRVNPETSGSHGQCQTVYLWR